MNKFSKKFPELKHIWHLPREGKEFPDKIDDVPKTFPDGTLNDEYWYYESEVEKHCLSKQKVREAILKCRVNTGIDLVGDWLKLLKKLKIRE